jgi:hypothetical protein
MSIQQNFPSISPSLSLNFARSKTLDPRITFTRTSSGTRTNSQGLIGVVSANTPRFDHSYDPVSGTVRSLGLLVEEQRTNLVTHNSTDFNYSINNQSIPTALDIAPDGNNVLCKHDLTGTTSPFLNCRANTTLSAGNTYTMSMWLKGTTNFNASFAFVGETVNEIYSNTANITTSWKRFTLTFSLVNTQTSSRLQVFFAQQGEGKVISIWGSQLEQGAFATSYINRPVAGQQSTRTADNASMVGENFSSWYNQSEGTVFTAFRCDNWNSSNQFGKVFTINQAIFGVENNGFWIGNDADNSNTVRYRVRSGGVNQFGPANLTRTSTIVKSAIAVKSSDFAITIDGNIPTTSTSGTLPQVMNSLTIGRDIIGVEDKFLNGHISQLTYYPKRLPNAFLQNLTK